MAHPYEEKYGKSCCRDIGNRVSMQETSFTYNGKTYGDYVRNFCKVCNQYWLTTKQKLEY